MPTPRQVDPTAANTQVALHTAMAAGSCRPGIGEPTRVASTWPSAYRRAHATLPRCPEPASANSAVLMSVPVVSNIHLFFTGPAYVVHLALLIWSRAECRKEWAEMMGGFGMGFVGILWIVVLGLVIWTVINAGNRSGARSSRTSREILDERLARGELSIDEYRKLRETLG